MSFTNNNNNGIGPEVEIVATDTNFDFPTSFNGEDAATSLQHELPFGDGAEEGHTTTNNKKAASYYKIALGVFSLSAVLLFFAAGTSVAVVRNNNAVIAPLPLTDCISKASKAPSTSKASKAPSSMPSVSVYPTVPLAAFSKPSVSGSPTVSLAPTVAPTAKASKAPSTPVSYSLSAKASKAPKAPKCSKSLRSLSLSV